MSKDRNYISLINTQRWRRLRASVLEECPFCEDCRAKGLVAMATEVHHVIPLESVRDLGRMKNLAYDRGNLVALCRDCHKARHIAMKSNGKEEKRQRDSLTVRNFASRWYGETPGGVFSGDGGGR